MWNTLKVNNKAVHEYLYLNTCIYFVKTLLVRFPCKAFWMNKSMQNFKIGLIYFEFVGNKAKGRISIKQENNLQENKKRKQENKKTRK